MEKFKEVAKIIAEIAECDINDVKLESSLEYDLGVDSLMGLEISVMVDRKFNVTLQEEDITQMKTPKDILKFIELREQEAN